MSDPDLILTDEQRSRLDRGEVLINTEPLSGSSTPRVTVTAVVDVPPERVWRVIDDCAGYPRTMAGVKRCRELSRRDGVVRVETTIGMPFPLKDLTAVTEATHTELGGDSYRRAWKLVEGDYLQNTGSWTLAPFDGESQRTLVVYQVQAEPCIRIPKAIQELAQKKALPRLIDKLRRVV